MKMGHCVAVLAAILAVGVVSVLCQQTTQTELDRFAKYTGVLVEVSTNHDKRENYEITFRLFNRFDTRKDKGEPKNLYTKDWKIKFNLKSRDILVRPTSTSSTTQTGLKLSGDTTDMYTLEPELNFQGLLPRGHASITIKAKGLSMFSSDIYPRFFIVAGILTPKNIENTDNEKRFVKLNQANNTFEDPSRINSVVRNLQKQSFRDRWTPTSPYTIPASDFLNITSGGNYNFSDITGNTLYIVRNSTDNPLNDIARKFEAKIYSLPGWNAAKTIKIVSTTVTLPVNEADTIHLIRPTIPINPRINYEETYELDVGFGGMTIKAYTDEGFKNAMSAMNSFLGEFDSLPIVYILDAPDFKIRSFKLDLTKNFVKATEIVRILKLMDMLRLNELVLVVADNHGWRVQMHDSLNFNELTEFAGRRCMNPSICLPPRYGSGADDLTSGSGFLTRAEYIALIKVANEYNINITPYVNVLGGMWAAKQASSKRKHRLIGTGNMAEANRLDIDTRSMNIPLNYLPEDEAHNDGLLDLCKTTTIGASTKKFIQEVINSLDQLYVTATGSPMKYFHAGGDSTTFYHSKKGCKGVTGEAFMRQILNDLVAMMKTGTKLRVHEEAVIPSGKNTCLMLTEAEKKSFVVDFHKISVGQMEDLTPEQWAFIDRDLSMVNGNVTKLLLENYTGTKIGICPWAAVYDCANKGYTVTMSPRGILALDNAKEIDFDANGNRGMRTVFRTDMMTILNMEPFNIHMNMDHTDDHYPINSYQYCKVCDCITLTETGKKNTIGLVASLDTSVIRNTDQLHAAIAPRLLAYAQRAWNRPKFEGILKAENPLTFLDTPEWQPVLERRGLMGEESDAFMNNYAYKEQSLLDALSIKYDIEIPGGAIMNTLDAGMVPPFPTIVRLTIPGAVIQYQEANGVDPKTKWTTAAPFKQLFTRHENNRTITGRYTFKFPTKDYPFKEIKIRVMSADGKRHGRETLVESKMEYVFPRNVPPFYLNGTCVPVLQDYLVDIAAFTTSTWNKIFNNVAVINEQRNALDAELSATLDQMLGNQYNYTEISSSIVELLTSGTMGNLPITRIEKRVYETELRYRNLQRGLVGPGRVYDLENIYNSTCLGPNSPRK